MRKERIISFVLVLVMLCSMPVYGAETANWFDNAIENAVSNGLYNSTTAKKLANEDLTRAEMAAVINRAFSSTLKASLDNFTDVPKKAWYHDDMAKAVGMGTFKGSDGKLNPENKITREETFAVLARSVKLTSSDLTSLDEFSDAEKISSWAKYEIAAMVTAGYVNGSNSKLNPKGNITRAEFAQIMDNMIKGYFKVEGTYTSIPNGNILINTPNVILKNVTVMGDLIIGDGVGDGDVTLDSVKVMGRTVIRGGGMNSIKIIGDSSMDTVIVTRVDGKVRVVVSGNSNVKVIEIADGSDDVFIEGKVGSVIVNAAGITVTANNAKIGAVSIEAEDSKVVVNADSTVDKIKLDAHNASVDVSGTVKSIEATRAAKNAAITTESKAKIDNIKTEASGTTVTGTGTVSKVYANANDVKVDNPNTTVSAGAGTTGVTVGGKTVESGKTVTQTTVATGSSGGGSSNGVGTSLSISGVNVSASANSNIIKVTANVANAETSDTATIVLKSKETVTDKIKTKEIKSVPVVNGKISKTIYGLSNATYDVTVSVGNVSAIAPNSVVVFSPILTECSENYYLLNELLGNYDAKPKGVEFAVFDSNSSITGGITDYTYNVIATNQSSGAERTLISNGQFNSDELLAMHSSEGCSITCYLNFNKPEKPPIPDGFLIQDKALMKEMILMPEEPLTTGEYAITIQIKSTEVGNMLIGESSFEVLIDSIKPELSVDYTNECIIGYNISTMEYKDVFPWTEWSSAVDLSVAGSLKEFIEQEYGTTIYFRFQATESKQASEYISIQLPARHLAPSDLKTIPTNQGNNGKITLLNSANYQYKLYNADSWSDENIVKTASAQTYEIDNLAAGTYYIREKATDSNFASCATAITVFDNDSTEPAAPKLISACFNEDLTKIYLNFDKAMSAKELELSDFTIKGRPYVEHSITSIGLKDDDDSSIELTLSEALNYYPVSVSYTEGTVVACDGGVLATFSGRIIDNMHLKLSLRSRKFLTYGAISLLSVQGIVNTNYSAGYIFATDSTAPPAAGTTIDAIENFEKLSELNATILGNIEANNYLVLYLYDKDTKIVNGFGQVKITEENIGNERNIAMDKFASISQKIKNGTTKYAISFGNIGEAQTVTPGGINASDVTITTISGIRAYVFNTSDIAETGGTKSFTLTLSGDETNGQTNGVYTVELTLCSPSPFLEVDKNDSHRLNVSGAIPGAKIDLCIVQGSFWSNFMVSTADEYGNTFFEGLEAYNYFIYQTPVSGPGNGISSEFTRQVTITD